MFVDERIYTLNAGNVPVFLKLYEEQGMEVQVRILGRDVEDFYTVFVIDQERRLLGTMRLDDLVVADH